ncbi:MAG: rhodanese-like domain-containing protein [Candidatus Acetothermia bacterium]|jgi:rhodanese-related sulfurtransferase|nr:rhodanese-like domain-containing protein [Candidatus Acetothermia bacterium]
MKQWILSLVLVALVALGGWAGPRLVVDQPVYDFGQVPEGMLVQHVYVLRNVGDAPLNFTQPPSRTCGCTSVLLTKTVLLPGEQAELTVHFESTGYGGQSVKRSLTVYSDDPQAQTQTLTIQGFVRPAQPFEGSAVGLHDHRNYYLLVDLRDAQAFAQGHLLGAINIPFAELGSWIPRLPRWPYIYFYDETGAAAAQAAQWLMDQGFAARAVAGGLVGWWQELGGLFFVWAQGAPQTLPSGIPYYGGNPVSAGQVAQKYLVLLDLRDPQAFAQGHFPGAVNLPRPTLDVLAAWAAALPPRSALSAGGGVAIWCLDEDGTSAVQAAQYLWSNGFPLARGLIGGLAQWRLRYGDELLWPGTP